MKFKSKYIVVILLILTAVFLSSCSLKFPWSKKPQPKPSDNIVETDPKDNPKNEDSSNSDNSNIDKEPSDNSSNDTTPPADNTKPQEDKKDDEQGTIIVDNKTPDNLSNQKFGWGFKPNTTHVAPEISSSTKLLLEKYSGYYVGDTSSQVIYLTFDEGYENGYTPKILDVLKDNNVKAAFFVTRPYILKNPELIKRMVDEGHTVCNHSSKHPSMPSVANDIEVFKSEFKDTEDAFREITGKEMPKFFRPPMGEFSEKTLYLTHSLGYKTILWSFAHKDWLVNEQPSVETTIQRVLDRSHNGEIMLLHAVSKSNTDALDTIVKKLIEQGYRFGTLDELK